MSRIAPKRFIEVSPSIRRSIIASSQDHCIKPKVMAEEFAATAMATALPQDERGKGHKEARRKRGLRYRGFINVPGGVHIGPHAGSFFDKPFQAGRFFWLEFYESTLPFL
jgi:hypothetical protein